MICLCTAVPAPAGAAVFFIPLRAVPMEPSGSPAPAFLTHVFSRAIMKPKEEIPHDKSYVFYFDWNLFGDWSFHCPQNARHRVTVLLICLCTAVPAPAGAAVFFIPLRAVPMEPSGSPAPAFLTHVFSRAIMKPKEEIPHVKSSVSHFDWYWISWMPFLCPQIDWNHAELMLGFAQPFPPQRERLFLTSLIRGQNTASGPVS